MAPPSPPPSSASNATPRNPWNRNPQPTAAAATASAATPVLAEEPWPPLTAPQIAAGEAQTAAEAAFEPVPHTQPIPNRSPNPSGSRRGGRNNHNNPRRNHGVFHHHHHHNRFPSPSFSPPPHHVRNPNPNLAFNPPLPMPMPMPMPMQPQQQHVWFLMPTRDWGTMVPRVPLYQNGHGYNGYNDGVFAPTLYPHPMIAAHQQFPPVGPPAPVPGGPAVAPNRDVQLKEDIRRQIEYYFSEENLVKDVYLKQKMDEFGWVDIGLIGNFRKVAALTKDIEMIKSAMAASDVVQLEGDKMRTRYHWQRWTSK